MSGIIALNDPVRGMSIYDFAGLHWSTEPPTEPGWYWAIRNGETQIVNIRDGVAFVVGLDDYCVLGLFTHWLGPLPVAAAYDKALAEASEELRAAGFSVEKG